MTRERVVTVWPVLIDFVWIPADDAHVTEHLLDHCRVQLVVRKLVIVRTRPLRKNGDFSACWNERAMAIGGVCRWLLVVFGSTRPKQNPKKQIRRVWAGFSVGDITPDFRKCPLLGCINKGRRGFVLYVTQGPQIHTFFC